jgi:hypothetical protein
MGLKTRMKNQKESAKIYHITHIDNLPKIISDGCLWSDRARLVRGFDCNLIGMPAIKNRRPNLIPVPCHPGTTVGDYVPFYFCPRSVMLYIFHCNNHPDLPYRGGQQPIVHLQADLHACVDWANRKRVRFAFSNGNAGSLTADFFSELSDLSQINWAAIDSTDFRDRTVKEQKQAEFLVHESFPWSLVESLGVFDKNICDLARRVISDCTHKPLVRVENSWYF